MTFLIFIANIRLFFEKKKFFIVFPHPHTPTNHPQIQDNQQYTHKKKSYAHRQIYKIFIKNY
jgi:hypothetical protein